MRSSKYFKLFEHLCQTESKIKENYFFIEAFMF